MWYNLKYKIKKAFTLFEIMLALIIFSTLVGILFTTYININKSELNISNQQLISKTTNDFLERLHDLSIDYTIDYEEYFNRQLSNCQNNTNEFTRNTQWTCDSFSNYWNTGNENISWPYYCNSTSSYSSVSWYQSFLIGSQWWCRENLTWNQYYGEYKRQFRDTTDEYLNDWNDLFTGIWPIAIAQNTWVQELYLINKSWDSRVLFRRKYITGFDIDWDWFFTWDKEWLYSIQTLKLKWFDAWLNHNFDTWWSNWWVYDSFIDTRACDTQAWFVCAWYSIWNWEYSWYNLPADVDDGWVDITDSSVTISSRNFEIYPAKDPYLAKDDIDNLLDPFVKIILAANVYKSQIDENIILQTSIWFKNRYFNFPRQNILENVLWTCWDWTIDNPNNLWNAEECDDGNNLDWDWCTYICKREDRLSQCSSIDNAWYQIYNIKSSIIQTCYGIDLSWCNNRLPTTWTEYNEMPSTTECRFKCDDWYIRNTFTSECIIATQTWQCSAIDITWHQIYNTVSQISQNCISTSLSWCIAWIPSTWTTYNEIASTWQCYFKCEAWYIWSGDISVCESAASRSSGDFVTIWKTDNSWITNNKQIQIPTFPTETYNYNVDCNNDWLWDIIWATSDVICTYSNTWVYEVRISWAFPRIYFNNAWDKEKILSVKQWWTGQWSSMSRSFYGCSNLGTATWAIDIPNLSNVTDMSSMFAYADNFNENIDSWDVSNVTNMASIFNRASLFNSPLNSWQVGNVLSMNSMFNNTAFNQPLNNWDVSKVTNMAVMFYMSPFNQDISSRNVSQVQTMSSMFWYNDFNYNINNRVVNNVTNMGWMFTYNYDFNQPLDNWNVSNVTNMNQMFFWATNFNWNIGNWQVGNVIDMKLMFALASKFNQDISSRDVSKVTTMNQMFYAASLFNQNISSWDISNVTDMSSMFASATSFDQSLSWRNVSNVVYLENMFTGVKLSTENYDSTLIYWADNITLNYNRHFNWWNSEYCLWWEARNIIDNYWTIIDWWFDPNCNSCNWYVSTWDNDNFIDQSFWDLDPIWCDIINALYWNSTDLKTAYTQVWNNYTISSCLWVWGNNMSVVTTWIIPDSFDPYTIYIVPNWLYQLNKKKTLGWNCISLVWKGWTVFENNQDIASNSPIIDIYNLNYSIINDINLNGNSLFWAGIKISDSSNWTVNNIKAYNNGRSGIEWGNIYYWLINNSQFYNNALNYTYWNWITFNANIWVNIINNSLFYNNAEHGIKVTYEWVVSPNSTKLSINNSQFYNNQEAWIYSHSRTGIVLNNIQTYNNYYNIRRLWWWQFFYNKVYSFNNITETLSTYPWRWDETVILLWTINCDLYTNPQNLYWIKLMDNATNPLCNLRQNILWSWTNNTTYWFGSSTLKQIQPAYYSWVTIEWSPTLYYDSVKYIWQY